MSEHIFRAMFYCEYADFIEESVSSLVLLKMSVTRFFLQFESLPKCEVTQSKIDAPHQHFSVTTIFSVIEKHFLL